jgi:hypothetical protein
MANYILELAKYFPQVKDVFGIKIYASSSVDPVKVEHAAAITAEYLDSNHDGVVDDQRVVNSLLEFKSGIAIHQNEEEERKNKNKYLKIIKNHGVYLKALYGEEIRPVGSRFVAGSYEADGSLEEILHMITVKGYSFAYPNTFGFEDSFPGNTESSQLSIAARIARGGIDDDARESYPKHAWYRRFDKGCLWGCIVNEYIYWGLISYLGGLNQSCMDFDQVCDNHLDAGSEFFNEWELNTPKKIRSRDKALQKILTSKEYALPSRLPSGEYSQKTVRDIITGSNRNDVLRGSTSDDYLIGGEGNDKINGGKGDDIINGGSGNDKINGGKGSDIYILSPGKDKFQAVKLKHGDSVEIDKSIDFEITSLKGHTRIIHDHGITTINELSIEELTSIIKTV